MLTSEPPHLILDGISVFTDHADPLQLYYLPIAPHFATRETERGELPMFSLIEFSDGEETSGGLLNFTTSLGVDPDRLEDVRRQAMDALGLREQPRLSPVPIIDGTVRLILMGRATESDEEKDVIVDTRPVADDGETPDRFVLRMAHPAKPSLYGDMYASFSAELSQDAAEIVRQSLDGIIIPAAVIYSLTFATLRPAYSVRVDVDWERVQKHLKETFGANLIVFSSAVEKTVDELVEDRVIVIEADTFVTADDEDASVIGNKDRALQRVNDMVLETFFTPTLDPWKPPKDGWDRALEAVERLAWINPSGSEDALFSYNDIDYTRIDQKRLNATFSERTAIRRTIHPQAHLNGLVGELASSGLTVDDVVTRVRLGDPWFDSRELEVFNRADFEKDGITSIRVELDYEGERRTVLFDSATSVDAGGSTSAVKWPSRVEGDEMLMPVSAAYTVDFDDEVTARGVPRVSALPAVVTGTVLEIDPAGDLLYRRNVVTASVARRFPWDRYSAIEVWFGHRVVDGEIEADLHHRLEPGPDELEPEVRYAFTTLPGQPDTCHVKVLYRGSDSGDVAVPWTVVDGDLVTLDDPFPSKRRVDIIGAVPWADYQSIFVDLELRDRDGTVLERESVTLDATSGNQIFVADLADPSLQEVEYRVTAIRIDGSVVRMPTSVIRGPRLILTEPFAVQRVVRVELAPVDFVRQRVAEVTVSLRHEDLANGLRATMQHTFESPDDVVFFEYEFVDDLAEQYEVEVESRSTTGLRRRLRQPLVTADRALSLPLP
jgi:hypothetical protein